ncbi:MAG TPA: hypothetical protein VHZ24_11795 [Pirellulales bacterium]|nr:hypothetical protein [Pirellulales bacterium]
MRLVVLTEAHWIVGTFPTGGQRLLDLLNSAHSEFLLLSDVRLQERFAGSTTRIGKATIRKSQIVVATPAADRHEAPEKRRNALSSKRVGSAHLVVANAHLRGKVHLRGHNDSFHALVHELGDFFPVTEATLVEAIPLLPIELAVAIVNKSFVSVFSVGNETVDPASTACLETQTADSIHDVESRIESALHEISRLVGDRWVSREESQAPLFGGDVLPVHVGSCRSAGSTTPSPTAIKPR